jgi:hypothetical protein
VIDVVGGWYEASIEQQVLGACIESFQGHVISLSPHGSHLSRNLRTFLARLIVPATNRCMGSLQIVMLSAPTSLASIMVVGPHHTAVTHVGDSSEVGQREHMVRQWAIKVSGAMIPSYRKSQRRLSLTKWDVGSRSH